MYKVIFIDETPSDIDDFLDYLESKDGEHKFEIRTQHPMPDIDELINEIFKENIDAIIVDYQLNENKEAVSYNVPYTGVDLVEKVLKEREGFPCFVMTSFDDDAIRASQDVNVIYQKDILHGAECGRDQNASFFDRVFHQIEHYRARIDAAKKTFTQLVEKQREGALDATEETLLLKLDCFLEKAAHGEAAIPQTLKEPEWKKDLHKMIENTDKLLKGLAEND